MKYFLILSIILHLVAIEVFQGIFKPAKIINGHKIIEIGYILSQNYGNKKSTLKAKEENNLKDTTVKEVKKEEIVLVKENNEQIDRPDVSEENGQKNVLDADFGKNNPDSDKIGESPVNGSTLANLDMVLWFEEIRDKIEKLIKYPEEARRKNIEGVTLLEISFKNNGFIDHVKVFKSSGNKILDDEAVRIVKAAEPFPPLKEKNITKYSLRVPIRFSIKK